MKFHMIDKPTRNKHWHTAMPPDQKHVSEAVAWCMAHPSDSKFYYHYTNTRWWFESDKDAIMFTLRWAG